jgi:hypothetical protein
MMAHKQVQKQAKKARESKHSAPGPRLLLLKDAAKWLALTVWAMRERIWAGDIPVVRFPGGWKMYIDTRDLENLVQKNKTRFT